MEAAGIGDVKFILTDNEGGQHLVVLKNVIYLPGCAKNLISISQWSEEKGENAAILTRGNFSHFMCNDDKHRVLIEHPPDCKIPLMTVTLPGTDEYTAFLASESSNIIDNASLQRSVTFSNPLVIGDTEAGQQPVDVPPLFIKESCSGTGNDC